MTEQTYTDRAARGDQADGPGAGTSACCGAESVANTPSAAPVAAPCCGTADAARAAGSCCDPAAKTAAVGAGAGCCG
jgi:hypothetical protein